MLKLKLFKKLFPLALGGIFLLMTITFLNEKIFAQPVNNPDLPQLIKAFDEIPQVFIAPTKRGVTANEKAAMLEALNASENLKKQADAARLNKNYAEAARLGMESAKALHTIIKIVPDNALALMLRATKERNILQDLISAKAALSLLQKVNHQNNALRYTEAALSVQPNDPEIHYLKARIFEDIAGYYLPATNSSYGSSSSFLDSRPETPSPKPKEYAENVTKALQAAQKAAQMNSTNSKFSNLVNSLQNKLNAAK